MPFSNHLFRLTLMILPLGGIILSNLAQATRTPMDETRTFAWSTAMTTSLMCHRNSLDTDSMERNLWLQDLVVARQSH